VNSQKLWETFLFFVWPFLQFPARTVCGSVYVAHIQYSVCPSHLSTAAAACGSLLQTHPFNGPLSRTTRMSRYQKGNTNLDFTEARDSEWQWHQLGHMQVCTSLQTDNRASTPPLSFLQAGCPSCHPNNSVRALKAKFAANKPFKIRTERFRC